MASTHAHTTQAQALMHDAIDQPCHATSGAGTAATAAAAASSRTKQQRAAAQRGVVLYIGSCRTSIAPPPLQHALGTGQAAATKRNTDRTRVRLWLLPCSHAPPPTGAQRPRLLRNKAKTACLQHHLRVSNPTMRRRTSTAAQCPRGAACVNAARARAWRRPSLNCQARHPSCRRRPRSAAGPTCRHRGGGAARAAR